MKPKKELKEENIEKYDTSYITSNYENREADIIYKIKDRNVFFLIEHQSKIDKKMAYRILNYSIEIIRSVVRTNPEVNTKNKLPKVIPIVLYTGMEEWNAKKNIEEMQEQYEEYEGTGVITGYNLVDVRNKDELLEDELFISKIMLLDKVKEDDNVFEYLGKIGKTLKKEKYVKEFIKILRYSFQEENNENIENEILRIERSIEKGGPDMLRFAKVIKKQIRDSKKEGMQEGKKEGIIEMIKNMAKQGLNEEMILKYT